MGPDIRAVVDADTRLLEQALQKAVAKPYKVNFSIDQGASGALGRIRSQLGEFDKSLAASNARVMAFSASASAMYGVTKSLKEMVRVTVEVERKMTSINSILGAGRSQFKQFGNDLFKIARDTSTSFEEVADAAEELARQGVGIEETLKRTSSAMKLAKVSGVEVKTAVDAITAALNSNNDAWLDSEKLINKLVAVDAKFAVSAGGLAEAIKRVGSVASDAGLDIDDLIAAITSAQQTTARGEAVIGNALKTIFTRAQRPKVIEDFEALGIATKKASGENESLATVLTNVAKRYDDLSSAQQQSVSELVGGVYQINILKALFRDLGKETSFFGSALKTSKNATNEADRRVAELNETLHSLFKNLTVNLTQVGSSVGNDVFGPLFKNLLKSANAGLEQVTRDVSGESGQFLGKAFEAIFKGIGNTLNSPILIGGFITISRFLLQTAKEGREAIKTLAGLNNSLHSLEVVSADAANWLRQNPKYLQDIVVASRSAEGATRALAAATAAYNKEVSQRAALDAAVGTNASAIARAAGIIAIPGRGGTEKLQPKKAAVGLIPQVQEMAGAYAGGYKPGQVKDMNVPGMGRVYYNTAEKVKWFPGMGQPAIMPPQSSKAGRNYERDFADRHGFNPYAAQGMIPNFAFGDLGSGKTILNPTYSSFLREIIPLNRKKTKAQDDNLDAVKQRIRHILSEDDSGIDYLSRFADQQRYGVLGKNPEHHVISRFSKTLNFGSLITDYENKLKEKSIKQGYFESGGLSNSWKFLVSSDLYKNEKLKGDKSNETLLASAFARLEDVRAEKLFSSRYPEYLRDYSRELFRGKTPLIFGQYQPFGSLLKSDKEADKFFRAKYLNKELDVRSFLYPDLVNSQILHRLDGEGSSSRVILDFLQKNKDSQQLTKKRVAYGAAGQQKDYTYLELLEHLTEQDLSGGAKTSVPKAFESVQNRLSERIRAEIEKRTAESNRTFPIIPHLSKETERVKILKDERSLYEEGLRQGHCVGGYGDSCFDIDPSTGFPRSLIVSTGKTTAELNPVFKGGGTKSSLPEDLAIKLRDKLPPRNSSFRFDSMEFGKIFGDYAELLAGRVFAPSLFEKNPDLYSKPYLSLIRGNYGDGHRKNADSRRYLINEYLKYRKALKSGELPSLRERLIETPKTISAYQVKGANNSSVLEEEMELIRDFVRQNGFKPSFSSGLVPNFALPNDAVLRHYYKKAKKASRNNYKNWKGYGFWDSMGEYNQSPMLFRGTRTAEVNTLLKTGEFQSNWSDSLEKNLTWVSGDISQSLAYANRQSRNMFVQDKIGDAALKAGSPYMLGLPQSLYRKDNVGYGLQGETSRNAGLRNPIKDSDIRALFKFRNGKAIPMDLRSIKQMAGMEKEYIFNGLIPNFSPLSAAISRESAAVNPGLIRVGSHSALRGPGNPEGVGVYNLRDEPLGLGQGVERARAMGLNPKTHGIPNYASKWEQRKERFIKDYLGDASSPEPGHKFMGAMALSMVAPAATTVFGEGKITKSTEELFNALSLGYTLSTFLRGPKGKVAAVGLAGISGFYNIIKQATNNFTALKADTDLLKDNLQKASNGLNVYATTLESLQNAYLNNNIGAEKIGILQNKLADSLAKLPAELRQQLIGAKSGGQVQEIIGKYSESQEAKLQEKEFALGLNTLLNEQFALPGMKRSLIGSLESGTKTGEDKLNAFADILLNSIGEGGLKKIGGSAGLGRGGLTSVLRTGGISESTLAELERVNDTQLKKLQARMVERQSGRESDIEKFKALAPQRQREIEQAQMLEKRMKGARDTIKQAFEQIGQIANLRISIAGRRGLMSATGIGEQMQGVAGLIGETGSPSQAAMANYKAQIAANQIQAASGISNVFGGLRGGISTLFANTDLSRMGDIPARMRAGQGSLMNILGGSSVSGIGEGAISLFKSLGKDDDVAEIKKLMADSNEKLVEIYQTLEEQNKLAEIQKNIALQRAEFERTLKVGGGLGSFMDRGVKMQQLSDIYTGKFGVQTGIFKGQGSIDLLKSFLGAGGQAGAPGFSKLLGVATEARAQDIISSQKDLNRAFQGTGLSLGVPSLADARKVAETQIAAELKTGDSAMEKQMAQLQAALANTLSSSMGGQFNNAAQVFANVLAGSSTFIELNSTIDSTQQVLKSLDATLKSLQGGAGYGVRAGGNIPISAAATEKMMAKAGGYNPGYIRRAGNLIYNSAERVDYLPGVREPIISPPPGSLAGFLHKQNLNAAFGFAAVGTPSMGNIDPKMASFFVNYTADPYTGKYKDKRTGRFISNRKANELMGRRIFDMPDAPVQTTPPGQQWKATRQRIAGPFNLPQSTGLEQRLLGYNPQAVTEQSLLKKLESLTPLQRAKLEYYGSAQGQFTGKITSQREIEAINKLADLSKSSSPTRTFNLPQGTPPITLPSNLAKVDLSTVAGMQQVSGRGRPLSGITEPGGASLISEQVNPIVSSKPRVIGMANYGEFPISPKNITPLPLGKAGFVSPVPPPANTLIPAPGYLRYSTSNPAIEAGLQNIQTQSSSKGLTIGTRVNTPKGAGVIVGFRGNDVEIRLDKSSRLPYPSRNRGIFGAVPSGASRPPLVETPVKPGSYSPGISDMPGTGIVSNKKPGSTLISKSFGAVADGWTYEAMDYTGKTVKGVFPRGLVGNQSEALTRLKEMGYFPTKVTPPGGAGGAGEVLTSRVPTSSIRPSFVSDLRELGKNGMTRVKSFFSGGGLGGQGMRVLGGVGTLIDAFNLPYEAGKTASALTRGNYSAAGEHGLLAATSGVGLAGGLGMLGTGMLATAAGPVSAAVLAAYRLNKAGKETNFAQQQETQAILGIGNRSKFNEYLNRGNLSEEERMQAMALIPGTKEKILEYNAQYLAKNPRKAAFTPGIRYGNYNERNRFLSSTYGEIGAATRYKSPLENIGSLRSNLNVLGQNDQRRGIYEKEIRDRSVQYNADIIAKMFGINDPKQLQRLSIGVRGAMESGNLQGYVKSLGKPVAQAAAQTQESQKQAAGNKSEISVNVTMGGNLGVKNTNIEFSEEQYQVINSIVAEVTKGIEEKIKAIVERQPAEVRASVAAATPSPAVPDAGGPGFFM